MKQRAYFLTTLLFFQLALSVFVSLLPNEPLRRLAMLGVMLLPLSLLSRAPKPIPHPPLRPTRGAVPLLFLLPAFVLAVAALSIGWGKLAALIGITLRGAEPVRPLALAILLDAAVPAVGEELFARGAVLGILRPHGRRTAVFGSALIFALMHASLAQIPYVFLAGLLLGMLREVSGGLLLPILFHFATNLFSLLLLFGAPPLPLFIGLAACAALGLLLLLRIRPRLVPEVAATASGGIRELLLSPLLLWIAVILAITLL